MSRLRTELAGLPPKDLPQVDLEGFSAFADYFMDGLFTDLFESSGEDRVQIGVDNTLCEVDTLVKALEKELEEQEKTKDDLSRERETLLAGA